MFIGFSMILSPLAALANVVPFIGSLVGSGISIISFVVASMFSLVVIGFSWLAHRPVLGGSLFAICAVLLIFLVTRKSNRANKSVKLGKKSGPKVSVSKNGPKKVGPSRRRVAKRNLSEVEEEEPAASEVQESNGGVIDLDEDMNKYSTVAKSSTPKDPIPLEPLEESIHLDTKYYLFGKGKTYGPYSIDKLEDFLAKGKIKLSTPCREVDGENKIRVADIPGLKKSA